MWRNSYGWRNHIRRTARQMDWWKHRCTRPIPRSSSFGRGENITLLSFLTIIHTLSPIHPWCLVLITIFLVQPPIINLLSCMGNKHVYRPVIRSHDFVSDISNGLMNTFLSSECNYSMTCRKHRRFLVCRSFQYEFTCRSFQTTLIFAWNGSLILYDRSD